MIILKVGSTIPAIASRRGDFEHWLVEASGVDPSRVSIVDAQRRDPFPSDTETLDGVIITGSSAIVTERAPWSERAADWLRRIVRCGRPILGVCYGHQLLAHALGGRVGINPQGREIGTVQVQTTRSARSDPLWGSLPDTLTVQATHAEAILELPENADVLGGNEADPHQAVRFLDRVWGVQFHPEFDEDIVRSYIEARREVLVREGLSPETLLSQIQHSEHGKMLLQRFAAIAAGSVHK